MEKKKRIEPHDVSEFFNLINLLNRNITNHSYKELKHPEISNAVEQYVESLTDLNKREKRKLVDKNMLMIKRVMDHLLYLGLITENPLEGFRPHADQESIIRLHMTKKSLTYQEELTTNNKLCQSGFTDPMYFGMALMLYTGMKAQEVCALKFGDVRNILVLMAKHPEGKFKVPRNDEEYIFALSRVFRNIVGSYELTNIVESRSAFRILPISKMCKNAIVIRCDYLLNQGYNEKELADMPMVCKSGNDHINHCNPESLTAFVKKMLIDVKQPDLLIPTANLKPGRKPKTPRKEQSITTPLSLNISNRLLRTNFEYRARYECKLTESETNYMLGRTCGDVASKHYREFREIFNQYAILQKLNRWTISERPAPQSYIEDSGKMKTINCNNTSISISPNNSNDVAAVYVDLVCEPGIPISIELKCPMAMNGTISVSTEQI